MVSAYEGLSPFEYSDFYDSDEPPITLWALWTEGGNSAVDGPPRSSYLYTWARTREEALSNLINGNRGFVYWDGGAPAGVRAEKMQLQCLAAPPEGSGVRLRYRLAVRWYSEFDDDEGGDEV